MIIERVFERGIRADIRNFTLVPSGNCDRRFYCKAGENRFLEFIQWGMRVNMNISVTVVNSGT
jgi:hypothetical protein